MQSSNRRALPPSAHTTSVSMPPFTEQRGSHKQGWHPVVKNSSNDAFISNDLTLAPQQSMLIVTGPNRVANPLHAANRLNLPAGLYW